MQTKRPNLLFIMTDDQAAWTLGGMGHPHAHTPVLDRLGADGAVFRNVHAHDCVFDGTDVGVRIKTKPGRGGFVQDVVAERLTMRNIRGQAVLITQWYQGNPHDTVEIDPSLPVTRIADVTIRDVTCAGAKEAITLLGMPHEPFRRIALKRLAITAEAGIRIEATEDLRMESVTVRTAAPEEQSVPGKDNETK